MMDRQLNKGSRKIMNAVRSDARFSSDWTGCFFHLRTGNCVHRTPAADCIPFFRHTTPCGAILPTVVEAGKAC
jgi:hypothetical protein